MHTPFTMRLSARALTCLLIATACSSGRSSGTTDSVAASTKGAVATSQPSDSGPGPMARGEAMGATHQDTLAPKVQAHLQRLATGDPDSLRALVPEDRRVVTALIQDCEQMMREMKMDPPRKWRSAVQELQGELGRMQAMSGAQLQRAMPDHRRHIESMLAMRRDMMRM